MDVEVRVLQGEQAQQQFRPLFLPAATERILRFRIDPGATFQHVQQQFVAGIGEEPLRALFRSRYADELFTLFYKGSMLDPATQILLPNGTPNPKAAAVWPAGAVVGIEPTAEQVIVFTVGLGADSGRPAFDITIRTEFDTHPVEERVIWRDWESMSDRAKARYQQKIVSPAPMQFLAWRALTMNNIGLAVMRQVRRAPELRHINDWSDVGFEIRLLRNHPNRNNADPQDRSAFWRPNAYLNYYIVDFDPYRWGSGAKTLSELLLFLKFSGFAYLYNNTPGPTPLHFLVRMTYGSSQGMPWRVRNYSDRDIEKMELLRRFCERPDPTTSNYGLEDVRPATWSVANMDARHLQLTGSLPAPPASTST